MAGLHSGHHCSSHSSCMQAYLYREIELVMAQCTKFIEAKGIGTGARGSDVVMARTVFAANSVSDAH